MNSQFCYNIAVMNHLNTALFTTSIVTVAILISACGSLIISTSSRLIRVTDICRNFCERAKSETDKNELDQIFIQLEKIGPRIKLLETALTLFYISISSFTFTTLFLSLDQIIPQDLQCRSTSMTKKLGQTYLEHL